MNDEEVLWVCMRDQGQTPMKGSKTTACTDCKKRIFYDPNLVNSHPLIAQGIKVCNECGYKRMATTKDPEVKLRWPHRENKYN